MLVGFGGVDVGFLYFYRVGVFVGFYLGVFVFFCDFRWEGEFFLVGILVLVFILVVLLWVVGIFVFLFV